MKLVKKGLLYLRQNGIALTIRKTVNKCYRAIMNLPLRIAEPFVAAKRIKMLREKSKSKNAYIIIPCIDWHIPLFQRPHQIAWELSLRKNSIVFFLPDQYQYDSFCFSREVKDDLFLYSIPVIGHLNKILSDCIDVTIMMTWTRQAGLLNKIVYDKFIYDYVDDLALFYYHDKEMEEIHQYLMKVADLTTVTADRLYKNATTKAKKLLLSENAGDYQFFNQQKGCSANSLIAPYLKKYKAVLGYYGCLAHWFDYETILFAAKERDNWLFIIVGHLFDESAKKALLNKPDNILYVPAQPYRKLPSFLTAFDIALVPFVINDITLATSPVKIFEYMAGGKPVLSSNLPECKKYKSVFRYRNKEDFIKQAENILSSAKDPYYLSLLDKEARENTWGARVDNILEEISKCAEVCNGKSLYYNL